MKSRIAIAFLFCNLVGVAMFAPPQPMPIDRVIDNVTRHLKSASDEQKPELHYTLARAHYLAFANNTAEVPSYHYNNGQPVRITPDYLLFGDFAVRLARQEKANELAMAELELPPGQPVPRNLQKRYWQVVNEHRQRLQKENWQPPALTAEQALGHATKAAEHFQTAMRLAPKNGLYQLGAASLAQQVLERVPDKLPAPFAELDWELVGTRYLAAYDAALAADKKVKHRPVAGLRSLTSYEAGKHFLALVDQEKVTDAELLARADAVRKMLAQFDKLRHRAITPVVYTAVEHERFEDLLGDRIVRFDLDGDGVVERRRWIRPEVGLLVWDPGNTGRITSGRQLFGNATWWMLFKDGYAALQTLDDNADGQLGGAELRGIGVWFDRNANGISDPTEVTPLHEAGIRAIATTGTLNSDGILANPTGITLDSGVRLPSYDWVAEPIE